MNLHILQIGCRIKIVKLLQMSSAKDMPKQVSTDCEPSCKSLNMF